MIFKMRPEQEEAHNFLLRNNKALLLADPGAGKTGTILSLMGSYSFFGDYKWLVLAPRLVIPTAWEDHLSKFDNFDFDYTVVHGNKREERLHEDHQIYLTTTDYVRWLVDQDLSHIGGVVVDEVDKFKNHSTKRFKALKALSEPFEMRFGMTGTPCTRSLEQLYPQSYIIDRGGRLGKNISEYRRRYFFRGGFKGYEYIPREGALDNITEALRPIAHRMEVESEEPLIRTIPISLPDECLDLYKAAKRKLRIQLEKVDRVVGEAGSAYGVMRQICAGGIYDPSGDFEILHTLKVDRLKELNSELQGKKILVFYHFRFEKRIIKDAFGKSRRICFLDSETKASDVSRILKNWGNDKYDYMFAQASSTGHGIDGLQRGCRDIYWMTLPDDLSIYLQANGRIVGPRAEGTVRVHHPIVEGSIDRVIFDQLKAKKITQQTVLDELAKSPDF